MCSDVGHGAPLRFRVVGTVVAISTVHSVCHGLRVLLELQFVRGVDRVAYTGLLSLLSRPTGACSGDLGCGYVADTPPVTAMSMYAFFSGGRLVSRFSSPVTLL